MQPPSREPAPACADQARGPLAWAAHAGAYRRGLKLAGLLGTHCHSMHAGSTGRTNTPPHSGATAFLSTSQKSPHAPFPKHCHCNGWQSYCACPTPSKHGALAPAVLTVSAYPPSSIRDVTAACMHAHPVAITSCVSNAAICHWPTRSGDGSMLVTQMAFPKQA